MGTRLRPTTHFTKAWNSCLMATALSHDLDCIPFPSDLPLTRSLLQRHPWLQRRGSPPSCSTSRRFHGQTSSNVTVRLLLSAAREGAKGPPAFLSKPGIVFIASLANQSPTLQHSGSCRLTAEPSPLRFLGPSLYRAPPDRACLIPSCSEGRSPSPTTW